MQGCKKAERREVKMLQTEICHHSVKLQWESQLNCSSAKPAQTRRIRRCFCFKSNARIVQGCHFSLYKGEAFIINLRGHFNELV